MARVGVPAVVAWLVLVALAGCSGQDDGSGDEPSRNDPSEPEPRPGGPGGFVTPEPARVPMLLDFRFEGCQGFTLRQPTPLEDVQGLLPDGYLARPLPDAGEATGLGELVVDLYSCRGFATPNAVLNDTWFGEAYTPILAPEWSNDTAAPWRYTFQLLASNDRLSRVWQVAGFDQYNASGSLSWAGAAGVAGALQVQLGDYQLSAATGPDATEVDAGPHVRVHQRADGHRLVWTGTWERAPYQMGQGQLNVPADTPFAGSGTVSPSGLSGPFQFQADAALVGNDLWLDVVAGSDALP